MRRLSERAEAQIVVKKSRFIAVALPISSLDEVKGVVKAIWQEHPDATHVVHAAVVGRTGTLYSCSDDREPKNTAGRPALEVLKGSGLTDIIVCVVRYFGGTLLGTGGLVKAYGDAVKEVLAVARSEEIVSRRHFSMLIGYEFHDRLQRTLSTYDIAGLEEDFGEGIRIEGDIVEDAAEALKRDFQSLTMGRCRLTWSE